MPAPPDIPGYRILRTLGEGAYGAVYEAHQLELGRTVALKVVHPGAGERERVAARFKREGLVLSKLRHPGIVGLLDAGRTERGLWFLAMEFVDGRPLSDSLERPWAWSRAVELLRPVAEALAAAHAQGVIHRDIKPSNILVDARGAPRIADFGLSALTARGATRLTRSGATPGTPQYLPPEAVEGRDQGPPGDVYALASTLVQLLTGEPAYGWIHSPADLHRRCLVPAPRLTEALAPPWLADLVAGCLERDPELRPTAATMAACLAEARSPPGTPRASTLALARRDLASTGARPRPGRFPLGPSLLALALGLGFWTAKHRPAPASAPAPSAGAEPAPGPEVQRGPVPPAGLALAGRRFFPLPLPAEHRHFVPGSVRESSDLFVPRERDPDLDPSGWPADGLELELHPGLGAGASLVLATLVLDGDPRRIEAVSGEGRIVPLALKAAPADCAGPRLSVLVFDPGTFAPGTWRLRPAGAGAGRLLGAWWGFAGVEPRGTGDLEILSAALRIEAGVLAMRLDEAAAREGAALDPISGFFDVNWTTRLSIHRERGLLDRLPYSAWLAGLAARTAEVGRRIGATDPGTEPEAVVGYLLARWHFAKAALVLGFVIPGLDRVPPCPPALGETCPDLEAMTRARAPVDAGQPELAALRAAAAALRTRLGPGPGHWLDWLVERAILDGRSGGYGLPPGGDQDLDRVMAAVEALPPGPAPGLLGPANLARELVFLAGGTTGATGQPLLTLGPERARALERRAIACLEALPAGPERNRELALARVLVAERAGGGRAPGVLPPASPVLASPR